MSGACATRRLHTTNNGRAGTRRDAAATAAETCFLFRPRWFPMQSKTCLDALHQRPVFMAAMSNVPTIAALHTAAQAVAIATITTTGTIGAGVRTRVQD